MTAQLCQLAYFLRNVDGWMDGGYNDFTQKANLLIGYQTRIAEGGLIGIDSSVVDHRPPQDGQTYTHTGRAAKDEAL